MPTCYRHPGRETYVRCQRCGRPICPDCMRSAAVGYQCPGCVAEGVKATRSGRTPYGGPISANPALTSWVLIGLNAAVWLLIMATGGGRSRWSDVLSLQPKGVCTPTGGGGFYPDTARAACERFAGGTWVPGVDQGAVWELITSVFTHVDVLHIGLNMLMLFLMGPELERLVGRSRFLALYLISGLAGSAAVMWLSAPMSTTLGASGAIFGLLGGLLAITLKVGGNPTGILVWVAVNAAYAFFVNTSISWQGHLGGFLGGLACAAVLAFAPRTRRTLWQSAGLVAVLVLVLAVTFARTLVI